MRAKLAAFCVIATMAGNASAQLVDTMAAVAVSDQLAAGSVSGGLNPTELTGRANAAAAAANTNAAAQNAAFAPPSPMPPAAPGFAPPVGGGFAPPASGFAPPAGGFGGPPGLSAGMGMAVPTGGTIPGLTGAAVTGPGAFAGQAGAPTPTPIPMIEVLVGKRVFCAVCGNLLEDAFRIKQPVTEQDKYLDDGTHDNGIAGDGIRGNVETIKGQYIGAECHDVQNRLINVVNNAENIVPPRIIAQRDQWGGYDYELPDQREARLSNRYSRMADQDSVLHFFGVHVATLDPFDPDPKVPRLLEKEQQRDDLLRDWNARFLANFRVNKNDPQSQYFQLYVPEPPQLPKYPMPPGYVAPQTLGQPGQAAGGAGLAPTPNIFNGQPVI
jgi:hypothetical protein